MEELHTSLLCQKGKVFTWNIYVYFHKPFFSQTYLIWASKLDVPKIGLPQPKWTQNTPCNYSVYLHKIFYERFIKLRLSNHGSSTFRLFTHLLFFVFLIINKINLNRWKQNSRDISNCNICTKFVFYKC